VLNVSADHLDRHTDMAGYAKEKEHIFRGDGHMVINLDDPVVKAMQHANRNTYTFSVKTSADFYLADRNGSEYLMFRELPLMPLVELPLEGRHNAANALAAFALGTALNLDVQAMCKALKNSKAWNTVCSVSPKSVA